MKHFKIVLGLQKSVLKQFTVTGHCKGDDYNIFLKRLQHVLKSKAQPLKVEKFIAERMNQNRLMSILPILDSNTLTTIDLRDHGRDIKVDKLLELDQWRNIKQLISNVDCYVDYDYIEHFTHFSNEKIWFESIQFPDLVSLKDLFLQSSGFEVIKIKPINFDMNEVQQNIEALGESILDFGFDEDIKYIWYYHMLATNDILEINIVNATFFDEVGIRIMLTRREESYVPREAVFQN